jgi:hypothetical protein
MKPLAAGNALLRSSEAGTSVISLVEYIPGQQGQIEWHFITAANIRRLLVLFLSCHWADDRCVLWYWIILWVTHRHVQIVRR